jgi:ADP-ribose pyrophosphatase YjhB (NUDIX family)
VKPASESRWTGWTARLQAIAQNGLTFARDPYDVERYSALRDIAAEMIAAGSDIELRNVQNLLTSDLGYCTPKVDVRGIVFRGDKLLLVQEKSDGGWTAPGGWADVGVSPAENVVREIHEEAGFRARVVKLLAVFDRNKHPHPELPFHVYKLFFLCEIIDGTATPSAETLAVGFFGEHEIPPLSTGRITLWQIQHFFEHHRHPKLPTDFD